uniref:Myb-like domain-containing protein n=1 Tax=viral metagenome TaxID=1070528 RepID=A0A6C0AJB9_9ZZZZ
MQTRSTVSKRPVPASRVVYERDNHRWTVAEEREMIRLRRHENMPYANIAWSLRRSPEAIKFRFDKLVNEHMEGASRSEVLRWFNLTEE